MQLAKVVGTVVASAKSARTEGLKMLIVQPIQPNGTPTGKYVVAFDAVGAGLAKWCFMPLAAAPAKPQLQITAPQMPPSWPSSILSRSMARFSIKKRKMVKGARHRAPSLALAYGVAIP